MERSGDHQRVRENRLMIYGLIALRPYIKKSGEA